MEPESEKEYEESARLSGDEKGVTEMHNIFAEGGIRAVARWKLDRVLKASAKHYVSPLQIATQYARLGNKEETLKYLEVANQQRTPFLVQLVHSPDFNFVHSDPRYKAIVQQMGLPQ